MSSINNLLKQARQLAGATSDDVLDEEWAAMCAGARDELIRRLGGDPDNLDTEAPEELTEEHKRLRELLRDGAEESKQAWIASRLGGRR